jgi:hypothetical protein
MHPRVVFPGVKFNHWTVISIGKGCRLALCRCDCGREKMVDRSTLTGGQSKGCHSCQVSKRNFVHGDAPRGKRPSEYTTWASMIQRCEDSRHKDFRLYGGRGVIVCNRWRKSYKNFLSDVGRKPSVKHSIDRIETNGNYEPGNVRWATPSEQQRNRRPFTHRKGA